MEKVEKAQNVVIAINSQFLMENAKTVEQSTNHKTNRNSVDFLLTLFFRTKTPIILIYNWIL